MKILIVDDSPVARKILRSCFPADRSFEISEAGDGSAGVAKFEEVRPDLVFTDLTMPGMDGFQALARIKKIDPGSLVVVCSADIQPKTIERVMEMGAFDMLKKPPSRDLVAAFFRKIDDFLKRGVP